MKPLPQTEAVDVTELQEDNMARDYSKLGRWLHDTILFVLMLSGILLAIYLTKPFGLFLLSCAALVILIGLMFAFKRLLK